MGRRAQKPVAWSLIVSLITFGQPVPSIAGDPLLSEDPSLIPDSMSLEEASSDPDAVPSFMLIQASAINTVQPAQGTQIPVLGQVLAPSTTFARIDPSYAGVTAGIQEYWQNQPGYAGVTVTIPWQAVQRYMDLMLEAGYDPDTVEIWMIADLDGYRTWTEDIVRNQLQFTLTEMTAQETANHSMKHYLPEYDVRWNIVNEKASILKTNKFQPMFAQYWQAKLGYTGPVAVPSAEVENAYSSVVYGYDVATVKSWYVGPGGDLDNKRFMVDGIFDQLELAPSASEIVTYAMNQYFGEDVRSQILVSKSGLVQQKFRDMFSAYWQSKLNYTGPVEIPEGEVQNAYNSVVYGYDVATVKSWYVGPGGDLDNKLAAVMDTFANLDLTATAAEKVFYSMRQFWGIDLRTEILDAKEPVIKGRIDSIIRTELLAPGLVVPAVVTQRYFDQVRYGYDLSVTVKSWIKNDIDNAEPVVDNVLARYELTPVLSNEKRGEYVLLALIGHHDDGHTGDLRARILQDEKPAVLGVIGSLYMTYLGSPISPEEAEGYYQLLAQDPSKAMSDVRNILADLQNKKNIISAIYTNLGVAGVALSKILSKVPLLSTMTIPQLRQAIGDEEKPVIHSNIHTVFTSVFGPPVTAGAEVLVALFTRLVNGEIWTTVRNALTTQLTSLKTKITTTYTNLGLPAPAGIPLAGKAQEIILDPSKEATLRSDLLADPAAKAAIEGNILGVFAAVLGSSTGVPASTVAIYFGHLVSNPTLTWTAERTSLTSQLTAWKTSATKVYTDLGLAAPVPATLVERVLMLAAGQTVGELRAALLADPAVKAAIESNIRGVFAMVLGSSAGVPDTTVAIYYGHLVSNPVQTWAKEKSSLTTLLTGWKTVATKTYTNLGLAAPTPAMLVTAVLELAGGQTAAGLRAALLADPAVKAVIEGNILGVFAAVLGSSTGVPASTVAIYFGHLVSNPLQTWAKEKSTLTSQLKGWKTAATKVYTNLGLGAPAPVTLVGNVLALAAGQTVAGLRAALLEDPAVKAAIEGNILGVFAAVLGSSAGVPASTVAIYFGHLVSNPLQTWAKEKSTLTSQLKGWKTVISKIYTGVGLKAPVGGPMVAHVLDLASGTALTAIRSEIVLVEQKAALELKIKNVIRAYLKVPGITPTAQEVADRLNDLANGRTISQVTTLIQKGTVPPGLKSRILTAKSIYAQIGVSAPTLAQIGEIAVALYVETPAEIKARMTESQSASVQAVFDGYFSMTGVAVSDTERAVWLAKLAASIPFVTVKQEILDDLAARNSTADGFYSELGLPATLAQKQPHILKLYDQSPANQAAVRENIRQENLAALQGLFQSRYNSFFGVTVTVSPAEMAAGLDSLQDESLTNAWDDVQAGLNLRRDQVQGFYVHLGLAPASSEAVLSDSAPSGFSAMSGPTPPPPSTTVPTSVATASYVLSLYSTPPATVFASIMSTYESAMRSVIVTAFADEGITLPLISPHVTYFFGQINATVTMADVLAQIPAYVAARQKTPEELESMFGDYIRQLQDILSTTLTDELTAALATQKDQINTEIADLQIWNQANIQTDWMNRVNLLNQVITLAAGMTIPASVSPDLLSDLVFATGLPADPDLTAVGQAVFDDVLSVLAPASSDLLTARTSRDNGWDARLGTPAVGELDDAWLQAIKDFKAQIAGLEGDMRSAIGSFASSQAWANLFGVLGDTVIAIGDGIPLGAVLIRPIREAFLYSSAAETGNMMQNYNGAYWSIWTGLETLQRKIQGFFGAVNSQPLAGGAQVPFSELAMSVLLTTLGQGMVPPDAMSGDSDSSTIDLGSYLSANVTSLSAAEKTLLDLFTREQLMYSLFEIKDSMEALRDSPATLQNRWLSRLRSPDTNPATYKTWAEEVAFYDEINQITLDWGRHMLNQLLSSMDDMLKHDGTETPNTAYRNLFVRQIMDALEGFKNGQSWESFESRMATIKDQAERAVQIAQDENMPISAATISLIARIWDALDRNEEGLKDLVHYTGAGSSVGAVAGHTLSAAPGVGTQYTQTGYTFRDSKGVDRVGTLVLEAPPSQLYLLPDGKPYAPGIAGAFQNGTQYTRVWNSEGEGTEMISTGGDNLEIVSYRRSDPANPSVVLPKRQIGKSIHVATTLNREFLPTEIQYHNGVIQRFQEIAGSPFPQVKLVEEQFPDGTVKTYLDNLIEIKQNGTVIAYEIHPLALSYLFSGFGPTRAIDKWQKADQIAREMMDVSLIRSSFYNDIGFTGAEQALLDAYPERLSGIGGESERKYYLARAIANFLFDLSADSSRASSLRVGVQFNVNGVSGMLTASFAENSGVREVSARFDQASVQRDTAAGSYADDQYGLLTRLIYALDNYALVASEGSFSFINSSNQLVRRDHPYIATEYLLSGNAYIWRTERTERTAGIFLDAANITTRYRAYAHRQDRGDGDNEGNHRFQPFKLGDWGPWDGNWQEMSKQITPIPGAMPSWLSTIGTVLHNEMPFTSSVVGALGAVSHFVMRGTYSGGQDMIAMGAEALGFTETSLNYRMHSVSNMLLAIGEAVEPTPDGPQVSDRVMHWLGLLRQHYGEDVNMILDAEIRIQQDAAALAIAGHMNLNLPAGEITDQMRGVVLLNWGSFVYYYGRRAALEPGGIASGYGLAAIALGTIQGVADDIGIILALHFAGAVSSSLRTVTAATNGFQGASTAVTAARTLATIAYQGTYTYLSVSIQAAWLTGAVAALRDTFEALQTNDVAAQTEFLSRAMVETLFLTAMARGIARQALRSQLGGENPSWVDALIEPHADRLVDRMLGFEPGTAATARLRVQLQSLLNSLPAEERARLLERAQEIERAAEQEAGRNPVTSEGPVARTAVEQAADALAQMNPMSPVIARGGPRTGLEIPPEASRDAAAFVRAVEAAAREALAEEGAPATFEFWVPVNVNETTGRFELAADITATVPAGFVRLNFKFRTAPGETGRSISLLRVDGNLNGLPLEAPRIHLLNVLWGLELQGRTESPARRSLHLEVPRGQGDTVLLEATETVWLLPINNQRVAVTRLADGSLMVDLEGRIIVVRDGESLYVGFDPSNNPEYTHELILRRVMATQTGGQFEIRNQGGRPFMRQAADAVGAPILIERRFWAGQQVRFDSMPDVMSRFGVDPSVLLGAGAAEGQVSVGGNSWHVTRINNTDVGGSANAIAIGQRHLFFTELIRQMFSDFEVPSETFAYQTPDSVIVMRRYSANETTAVTNTNQIPARVRAQLAILGMVFGFTNIRLEDVRFGANGEGFYLSGFGAADMSMGITSPMRFLGDLANREIPYLLWETAADRQIQNEVYTEWLTRFFSLQNLPTVLNAIRHPGDINTVAQRLEAPMRGQLQRDFETAFGQQDWTSGTRTLRQALEAMRDQALQEYAAFPAYQQIIRDITDRIIGSIETTQHGAGMLEQLGAGALDRTLNLLNQAAVLDALRMSFWSASQMWMPMDPIVDPTLRSTVFSNLENSVIPGVRAENYWSGVLNNMLNFERHLEFLIGSQLPLSVAEARQVTVAPESSVYMALSTPAGLSGATVQVRRIANTGVGPDTFQVILHWFATPQRDAGSLVIYFQEGQAVHIGSTPVATVGDVLVPVGNNLVPPAYVPNILSSHLGIYIIRDGDGNPVVVFRDMQTLP